MITPEIFIKSLITPEILDPAVITYNRLEPRPRSADFERSLKAEIRDALWMLARQWQTGEFTGEDASRAIQLQACVHTTRVTRVSRRNDPAEAYDSSVPLEAFIEAEPAPVDLRLRLEMGQYWLRLLRQFNVSPAADAIFRGAYPVEMPEFPAAPHADVPDIATFADRDTWQWYTVAQGRAVDGAALYRDLVAGLTAANIQHNGQAIPALDADGVNKAQAAFVTWGAGLFFDPPGTAWKPSNLEYQFACSAPRRGELGAQDVLVAEEYPGGTLDWYSFDLHADSATRLQEAEGVIVDDDVLETHSFTMLPAPVSFAGMANPRWWEFEDSRTNFGHIQPDKTDIAKLLLVEFGLVFGNDWLIVPFAVPIGSLCEVAYLTVDDNFGQRTLIRAAAQNVTPDWQVFTLSTQGNRATVNARLFIPPVIAGSLESKPIERVTFTRDEMSNLVWAIETVIPGERSSGLDGYESAIRVRDLLEAVGAAVGSPLPPPPVDHSASILYRLATNVPENWIPFIAGRRDPASPQIDLRRARLPRLIQGLDTSSVRPRGEILRPEPLPNPYYIYENEVPRAGITVGRSYQRTRWQQGQTISWLGRRKRTGRAESSAGLRFDQIEDVPTKNG